MRTNLFKQMFNQLGNAKGVVMTLMAVVCLLWLVPQEMKAEKRYDFLNFRNNSNSMTCTNTAGSSVVYNPAEASYNNKSYTERRIYHKASSGRLTGVIDNYAKSGSSYLLNGNGGYNRAYDLDVFLYEKFGLNYSSSHYAKGTSNYNYLFHSTNGLHFAYTTYNAAKTTTFSTTTSGVYIGVNSKVVVRNNATSSSAQASSISFNSGSAVSVAKGKSYEFVIPSTTQSFSLSCTNGTSAASGIVFIFLERIIPEVKSETYQDYGSGYSHDVGTMEKNTTSSTQTLVFDVADGQAVGDFRATITKNSGSGTFSTPSLSLNAAGDKLTVTFTYTSGNADEPINGTMLIESVNTVNTTSYSIGIGGTVGSAKNANTLAWDIAASQFVNTTYLQTEYLTGKNSDGPIHVTLSNQDPAGVAELQTGDKIKFTKFGTVKVTVEQEETGDFEGAVLERTFTVSKRTAVFSYAESTLFTETEYPGLISVTNDPNGSLLPNLSYGGAAPTYMEIDEDGTLTTKTGVGNSLALNITYAGDEEWNSVSESHNFKIVYKLPTPEFCLSGLDHMSDRVSDGVFIRRTYGTGTASWADGKLTLTGGSSYSIFVIRFDGIPSRLQYTLASSVGYEIEKGPDDASFTTLTGQVSTTTGDYALPSNTHYLRIQVKNSASAVFTQFCIKTEPTFTVNRTAIAVQTDGEISTPASFSVTPNDLKRVTISSSNPHFVVTPAELDARFSSNTPMPVEVDFNGSDFNETATLTINGYDNDNNPVSTVRTVAASVNFFHATHYAKAQAFVGSEGGSGTVYVSLNSTTPSGSSYAASSERASACGGAGQDDITFHYWAKNGDGYEFEGWYGMMDEETGELNDLISADEHFAISLTATSTDPADPTTGTLYANFIESATTAAPVYALEDLNLGSVASGEGGLTDRMALLPDGEYTRPLYIDRTRTTVAFSDIAGHAGESSLFSASAYNSGTKAFDITFTPTGVHPTSHTYQALATVTATNDIGTTIRTAVISATVTPAPLVTFTVESSHTYSNLQRNQSQTWDAVLSDITNAVGEPTISLTGANAAQFATGAYNETTHSFPIYFRPTEVGGPYVATATVSITNYDEVVTTHDIALTGTCVAAPLATYDVQNDEGQSVVNASGVYFGDFNVGDAATRTLYIKNLMNIKEGAIPAVSIAPEGKFMASAYNPATQSFNITFEALEGMTTVQNAVATFTVMNNDDVVTEKTVPLSAFVVQAPDFDVRVTDSEGNLIEGGETSWAEGLALANKAANEGCTVTLMRAVTGLAAAQEIKNTFTLDLNGKIISATINGIMLNVNGSGKTLTIKDSKMGGKIQNIASNFNGIAYGIQIQAGAIILKSGTVHAENTAVYNNSSLASLGVRAIMMKANTSFTMSGGEIEAIGGREVYGIYEESSAANATQITINGGTISADAPAYVYGIRAYGKVDVNGGTINVRVNNNTFNSNSSYVASNYNDNTLHRYGYGIRMFAYSHTTPANCYYGTLTMRGGTINVTNENKTMNGTTLYNEHIYGVYMDHALTGMGTSSKDATDGTNVQKASAIGSISNATINVTHAGVLAYGVLVQNNYNSYDNSTTPLVINNSTINVTTFQTAYGVYANASVNWDSGITKHNGHGGCAAGQISMKDCAVNATTTGGTGAYGAYVGATYGTIADAKATTGGQSAGNATYKGEYAVAGKLTANNCTFIADAATTTAHAVYTPTRAKTIRSIKGAIINRDASSDALGSLGGDAEAYPEVTINDGTYKATTGTGATAHTIRTGGYTTINGGEFESNAATSSAVTFYAISGKITANGATIKSTAKTDANAVYCPATVDAYTLYAYAGDVELNNCTATVNTTETTNARGIYVNSTTRTHLLSDFNTAKTANNSNYKNYGDYWQIGCRSISGKATVNGGTYTVKAYTSNAYGVLLTTNALSTDGTCKADGEIVLNNATFNVEALGTGGSGGAVAYGVQAGGKATIDGCTINAATKTSDARGVYSIDEKTVVSNSTINATTTTSSAYGIIGTGVVANNGVERVADFELNEGNKVTAKANTEGAYAIYMTGATGGAYATDYFTGSMAVAASTVINAGQYTANATTKTAYALHVSGVQVKNEASATPSIIVNDGKFKSTSAATYADVSTAGKAGYVVLNGGFFVNSTNLNTYAASDKVVTALANTRTEYSEGYRYEIAPPGGNYVCQIGSTKYKTLEEALSVVTSGQVIYMIADYTLPAGDYILPSGATLLIPYKDGTGAGASTAIGNSASTTTSGTTPYLFRKLTFSDGATLTSFGTIETSAQQKANGQYGANVGMASGPYGQLDLKEGSHIEMENGANLYCWGFVTGKGTINVKKGANTLEGFQLGDWCGGTNASNLIGNSQKVFPITHYFFQSIECPITYRPGSTAKGSTHINVSFFGVVGQDAISLVGTSGAMFLMTNEDASADTWVMRDYDETTDQCVWTLNSGASIGNLTINISGYNMASKDYDLPITTNMTIVMNYGTMSIGQNVVFFPGSKLIVNKEGTALINGVSVVLYDTDDWTGTKRYFATYSPSWGTTNPRSKIALTDAEAFVHGKIEIKGNGGLYTSAGSANIHSTNEDAGEIIYTTAAQGNKTSYFLVQGGTNKTALTVNPAKLKNGAGITPAFSESAGTAAGKTWTYYEDKWQCWTQASNCVYFDAINNPYAKPDEFVQLTDMYPDLFDNVYFDKETGNRVFVWDENCYWWEVNPTPVEEGIYRSINEDHNGKLNCYEYDEGASCWKIKNVTVTWNGEGVTTTNYTNVGYGISPKWLGATPTKSGYVWDGWQINGAGTVYTNDNLPVVTSNTTFTSHFVSNPVKYNITFKNDDGKVLESKNWESGAMPSYSGGTPTKDPTASQTFTWNGTWSPGITTVSAAKEYTAQYNANTRQYDVTFLDYDNTELETKKVNYNVTPSYTGDPSTPTRVDPEDYYEYTFSGWKNQQTGTSGLSAVQGDQVYVAQYTHHQKWFNIRFVDYNGTTLQTGPVLRNTMPTPPADPIRESDAQYDYTFNAWSPAIATATANATYTATYNTTLRSYTIRFLNYDGDVLQTETLNYGVTPEYKGETPTNADESLEFVGWDDVMRSVSSNKDYIAQYTKKTYTVTVTSAGNGSVTGGGTYTHGETATLTATPDDGYRFDHWNDDNTDNPRYLTVTATATYTATFVSDETGDYLDIVDWTNSTVTINANGWTASGWPYTVNGTPYAKNSRNADRTLTIPYSGDAGTNLTISVASGSVISNRMYPIPFINTIDGTTETSVVYINSGKLTIDGSKTLAAVYVAPGAELEITGSLTVGKLFLRTDNARSAILTNTGTLTATNVYYTRITRSNATYDQFGLPLDCALSSVTMSNAGKLGSSEMPYGSAWNLKSYNEASRAEYGKQDDGSNWTLLAADATIKGGTGYQMMSISKYFREYYFPVDLSLLSNSVPVSYTEGAAGPDHRGWNIICSPLTSVYTVISADPATGIKLNWLEPAGDAYVQEPASTILPARPFAFQTTESCTELVFNNDHSLVYHAPRRVAAADNTETEWLHLDIKDANNRGDQTSLYVHPSRFDEVYEAGVDVAKLSFSASHALLYSSHAYGEMAFAGVADELLEQGVALTVYSPKAQELTISMRNNEWLHRMAFVWLIDQATGAQIDLLESDYSFNAEAGTTAGRFILMGAFFAPQITTDNGTVQGDDGVKATKFIYKDKMYIKIDGVLYDATGKLVRK